MVSIIIIMWLQHDIMKEEARDNKLIQELSERVNARLKDLSNLEI